MVDDLSPHHIHRPHFGTVHRDVADRGATRDHDSPNRAPDDLAHHASRDEAPGRVAVPERTVTARSCYRGVCGTPSLSGVWSKVERSSGGIVALEAIRSPPT